ncbi:MAG: DNA methyltransferase [Bacilli bacterium]|nr:DNA methyltransferase [Bacilli bacterium]
MKLYSENDNYKLYEGNMLDMLDYIEPESISSIITDPPYELGFMNKGWDSSGIAFQKETWEKCFEVLKPGGYLLAFGGSRTYHRIACAIEDAGFEIRDTIMWMYGSGMAKGLNIGLAIDKKNGVESEIIGYTNAPDFQDAGRKNVLNGGENKVGFNVGDTAERLATPIYKAQNEWDGWNTCLKPAYEPIIVARKPFEGNCIDNILKYRIGGINIGECRVPISQDDIDMINAKASKNPTDNYNNKEYQKYGNYKQNVATPANINGRFPSNVILTYNETDEKEVCSGFPYTKSTGGSGEASMNGTFRNIYNGGWGTKECSHLGGVGDEGSAARYFYCAKTSAKDRDEGLDEFEVQAVRQLNATNPEAEEKDDVSKRFITYKRNIHPTVKPTELMQYLVRLVTPKGGVVLDPFNGSGSTGKACMWENKERKAEYKYIGIELTSEYLPIAQARIEYVINQKATTKEQAKLIDDAKKKAPQRENKLLNRIKQNKE